jgi:hypothetical protein
MKCRDRAETVTSKSRDRDSGVPRPSRDIYKMARDRAETETFTKCLETEPRHLKTCLETASSRATCLEDSTTDMWATWQNVHNA